VTYLSIEIMEIILHQGPKVVLDLPPFCKDDIVHFGTWKTKDEVFEWEIFFKDEDGCFVINIDFKNGSWYAQESWSFNIHPPSRTPRVESFHFISDCGGVWKFNRVEHTEFDYSNVIF
jgi:hypothetical protein